MLNLKSSILSLTLITICTGSPTLANQCRSYFESIKYRTARIETVMLERYLTRNLNEALFQAFDFSNYSTEGGKDFVDRIFNNPTLIRKIDVRAADSDGRTLLHFAARWNHVNAIKKLVQSGAKLNARNNNKETALHFAAWLNNVEAIKTLVELGAQLDPVSTTGLTPLGKSAWVGSIEAANTLLNYGAKINVRNPEGESFLHKAAAYGNVKAIKTLVELGASVNAVDKNGETPLHKVVKQKASYPSVSETIQTLIELGADMGAIDKKGETLLHKVAYLEESQIYNATMIVLELRRQKARSFPSKNSLYEFVRNKDGYIPFDLAVKLNNTSMAEVLEIDKGSRDYGPSNFYEGPTYREIFPTWWSLRNQ